MRQGDLRGRVERHPIGMMFAAFYAAIKYLGGGGFFANGQQANAGSNLYDN